MKSYWLGFIALSLLTMKLEDIYTFCETPKATFLTQELAVCYVLSVLLKGNSYGTELIQQIEQDYPAYRLSDTVLYSALKFLEDEQFVTSYQQKADGRGRPRRMYQLSDNSRQRAEELVHLFKSYMSRFLVPMN